MDDRITISGGIAATNTAVSQYILDSQEIIDDVMLKLQGLTKRYTEDGQVEIVRLVDDTHSIRTYNNYCLGWFRGKLQEILNKNQYLSNYTKEEMYREARYIMKSFLTELFYNAKEFELNVEKYEELKNTFSNYLSQSIRRAINESDKRFLQNTTKEETTKIQQTNLEEQKKEGGFMKLW